MLEQERPEMMPMPQPFDGYIEQPARVSSTCLVTVARNRYADVQGLTMVGMRSLTATTVGGSVTRLSENLPASSDAAQANFSLSYSQAPNGHAAAAWSQKGGFNKNDVVARIFDGSKWSAIEPVESSNDKDFILPEIAINDAGEATLAMADPDTSGGLYDLYILQRKSSGAWTVPSKVFDSGYTAVQVATDSYGNGLLTMVDGSVSKYGMINKAGTWSGLKSLLSSGQSFGYRNFHYQTMRALPDGQAIVVVGTRYETGYVNSGFALLR